MLFVFEISRIILLFALIALTAADMFSQTKGTIDAVIAFTPGEGQNVGQSPEYFPENIFGVPSRFARYDRQAVTPEEVCSLGMDGEIIVAFRDKIIVDMPGADFTIFENVFFSTLMKKIFVEPAVVSVSQDGINFIEFPYDAETLIGCAGITPTRGDKDPFNPEESGGDSFDLADIGLKWAKYIKIKDISRLLLNNPNHKYYDPTITGFDLDAVAGLSLNVETAVKEDNSQEFHYDILWGTATLNIISRAGQLNENKLKIYNLLGEEVLSATFFESYSESVGSMPRGIYVIVIYNQNNVFIKKVADF